LKHSVYTFNEYGSFTVITQRDIQDNKTQHVTKYNRIHAHTKYYIEIVFR